jgi:hypothetical protein
VSTQWFFSQVGKKFGPVTPHELKDMARTGMLQPSDLIWSASYKNWKQAKYFIGLMPQGMEEVDTSLSVLWRIDGEPGRVLDKLQTLLAEPDSAATRVTPPLPEKKQLRPNTTAASGEVAAVRTRPVAASATNGTTSTAVRPRTQTLNRPAASPAPAPAPRARSGETPAAAPSRPATSKPPREAVAAVAAPQRSGQIALLGIVAFTLLSALGSFYYFASR